MNCAICGKRTLRPQRATIEGKGEVLVCQTCYNDLGKTREQAQKSFKRKCPKNSHWDIDLHQCVKDRVPTPKIEEQKAAKELLKKIRRLHESSGFMWIGKLDESPSLDWLPPEIRRVRPLITGRAIHPVKTYHPYEWPEIRVYLEEELQKAAPGWIGTTPYLDHAFPIEDWKVIHTQYLDGELRYAIKPHEDRVLQAVRDGNIKHTSIEFDWMVPGGGIKFVNGVAPYGFKPKHISLLKDMEPGDPTSSVKLWEGITRKLKEHKLKDAIKHGKTYAYVKGTREQVHLPAPQVPARPVVPVGPITVEQKIDALQAAVTELERQMANVLGMLGIGAGRK
jgi:hypothetical protein